MQTTYDMIQHALYVVRNRLSGYAWQLRGPFPEKWFVANSDCHIDIVQSTKNWRMYLTVYCAPLKARRTFPQLMEGNWNWRAIEIYLQDLLQREAAYHKALIEMVLSKREET